MSSVNTESNTANWKYVSPETPGLHTVVSPENSECLVSWVFRLNLDAGQSYKLSNDQLELNAGVIAGSATLKSKIGDFELGKLDSFYMPAGAEVELVAKENLILYIAGGPDEELGEFFVRKYDSDLPLGDIRQIHGEAPYRRDVFMTINHQVPASRLICGFTWGDDGGWTSWPPHQHEKDLEEVYCYFDIPAPTFAMHLSYLKKSSEATVHHVSSGDMIIAPKGYHPTIAAPGAKSCYFWVLVAHRNSSRRYDLAVSDPDFA